MPDWSDHSDEGSIIAVQYRNALEEWNMPAPSTAELIAKVDGGPWWAEELARAADELLTDKGRQWLANFAEADEVPA